MKGLDVGVLLRSVAMLMAGTTSSLGADMWGGSASLSSDYLVRGISRSDDQAALQLDLHYLNSAGFVAGVFISNAQIDPGERKEAEVSAFVGWTWKAGSDWEGKALATHYAYPWQRADAHYEYDELTVDAVFRQWLDVSVMFSPNEPRYFMYRGLLGASAVSAEVNTQLPIRHRISAIGGVGYSHLGGPETGGYAYWSVGAAYDLAPWSLSVSFVDTSKHADDLFYDAAVHRRWMATAIWRF